MMRIQELLLFALIFSSLLLPKNKELKFSHLMFDSENKLNFKSESNHLKARKHLSEYVNKSFEISDDINLPSHTTFYQVESNEDIEVSYTVNDSYFENYEHFINSINDINFNDYQGVYPANNLVISEPMIFRGVIVKQITFIPYQINFNDNTIQVFSDVDFNIDTHIIEETRNYSHKKLSKLFEPLYEDMIINYEVSQREEDYQEPSILYICGGNSIDNSYVQDLIEWRHKTGNIVTAVSTSDIGGSGSNAVKNYIQNAYQNWDNPPEIVGLIGDTGGDYSIGYFTENWSGYSGEGDLPYSLLDGDDYLPEVYIGRISVNSSSELSNVINKALVYERAIYLSSDSDWYERAALCGDPSSSGQSTIITNEYVANILDSYGFEDIRGNYGNGNYDSWLENELEAGCLYMNYRGYYGASGFGSSEINGANNSYKTPFAVFITCGTGGFSGTSLSEELYRAGSVSNPKGAIAAVGTATTGTHTLFNNIVNMGIYDGIFPKGITNAGGAMASGRLSLLWTYPSDPNNWVGIFSHWTNLIGDPALELWTDTPSEMSANFVSSIDWGTNFIDVHVSDDTGLGVKNAKITLLKGDDEIFKTVKTDFYGNATIDLDYVSDGTVLLTVTKKNFKPIEGYFNIVTDALIVNVDNSNINIIDNNSEHTAGNNDGAINPGETVIIEIPLVNLGSETAYSLQANLSTNSELINIVNNVNQYGDLLSSDSSYGSAFYLVSFSENFIHSSEYELRLDITDQSGNQWASLIHPQIESGLLVFSSVELVGNVELNPGEETGLRVYLKNEGLHEIQDVTFSLLASGSLVDIIQGELFFGTIEPNQILNEEGLQLFVNSNTINGAVLNINANLSNPQGYNQNITFNVNVGHVTESDPLGPDDHGYYIYDSGDLGYSLAPIYDWIEIDNDYGGDGIDLNIGDNGDGNGIANSSVVVSLPFEFTFYGITYDQITVNSNGWISFGESLLESFRNYPIPGAGGPSPMIAAFWDDLKTSNGAEVYTYSGGNYFVIEWSEMRTNFSNTVETFQIILYDDSSLTPTGDNEIKIQYKEFDNTTSGSYSGWGSLHGAYSTIGLENMFATIGLEYTFNNEYPTASMPLHDQSAIFITTRNPVETLLGDANQDGEVNVLDIIVVVNHIVNLELLGSMSVYISDMDANGIINILDVIQIINTILDTN